VPQITSCLSSVSANFFFRVSVCAAGGRNGASAGKGNDGGGKSVELYL
jgi:hypothetical protein